MNPSQKIYLYLSFEDREQFKKWDRLFFAQLLTVKFNPKLGFYKIFNIDEELNAEAEKEHKKIKFKTEEHESLLHPENSLNDEIQKYSLSQFQIKDGDQFIFKNKYPEIAAHKATVYQIAVKKVYVSQQALKKYALPRKTLEAMSASLDHISELPPQDRLQLAELLLSEGYTFRLYSEDMDEPKDIHISISN